MKLLARLLGVDQVIPRDRAERALASGSLITTFGNGLMTTVEALYYTRVVGLSIAQVGFAMSIGAVVGVVSNVAMGRVADLRDPRTIAVVATFLEGLVALCLIFANSFVQVAAVLAVIAFLERGGGVARSVVITRLGGAEGQVRIRAFQRMVVNVGIGAGSLVGGLALAVDQPWAYRALIAIDAITFMAQALIYLRIPPMPALAAARHERATTAMRDRTYVTLSAINAVSCLHYSVGSIAVPLWVAFHTSAPNWVVAAALFVNTSAVVLFQVRLSRGVATPLEGAQVARGAGVLLAAGMLIYALAAATDSPVWATIAILVGSAVHVAGEIRQAAASWAIGFGLPPQHLQGQYQAVWQVGFSLERLAAPLFLTSVVIALGAAGWVLLAVLLLAAGAASLPVVQRIASTA